MLKTFIVDGDIEIATTEGTLRLTNNGSLQWRGKNKKSWSPEISLVKLSAIATAFATTPEEVEE